MKRIVSVILVLVLFFSIFPSSLEAQKGPEQVFDSCFQSVGRAYCRLITDNVKAWYARWYILSHAKQTIAMTYFIIDDDVFGMSLLGLLKKKAAEGVKIRLMMDARGTKNLTRTMLGQDYLQELLENPNIEIHVYNPLSGELLRMFGNIRNLTGSDHDKIIIVDGEWMITGGRNVSESYFADPADDPTSYRDTDVLFKGKDISNMMKKAFEEEFYRQENYTVKRDMFGNWVSRAAELEMYRHAMDRYMQGRGIYKRTVPALSGVLEKINKQLLVLKHMQDYASFGHFRGKGHFRQGYWTSIHFRFQK